MNLPDVVELIDGTIEAPTGELGDWLTFPDTGERIRHQVSSAAAAVETALAAADRVHRDGTWSGVPVAERAAILTRFSDLLTTKVEEMARADSVDSGVPLTVTREIIGATTPAPGVVARAAAELLYSENEGSAGECDQYWIPWGPAAVISPWNAPAPMAIGKAAAALAAGAPVILKPSEWAPHSASVIACAAQEAGLPPAVLQVLHGGADVGASIVADARVKALTYTGSSRGGHAVARASAELLRPVDLELSGCNPVVVLADADLADAAVEVASGMRALCGQWCAGPRRVFVPAAEVDTMADAILEAHAKNTVLGAVDDPATTLGPMAYAGHRDLLMGQISQLERSGASVRTAGALPRGNGHFVLPTVVTGVPPGADTEELFGPVVTLHGYTDVDDAVVQANGHEFGLSGYVMTRDRASGRAVGRRLRAGYVALNTIGFDRPEPGAFVSMWGRSGLSTLGGHDSVRFYTGARWVG
jgi:acyl-CoA reductase-like NAD-dependent aldehyde dehydrogenase